mgnify:CR=1 FL=1
MKIWIKTIYSCEYRNVFCLNLTLSHQKLENDEEKRTSKVPKATPATVLSGQIAFHTIPYNDHFRFVITRCENPVLEFLLFLTP